MRIGRSLAAGVAAAGLLGGVAVAHGGGSGSGFTTAVKPYAKGVPGSGWTTQPIISVGDVVPETGAPGQKYRMVGLPDGLGAYSADWRGEKSRRGGKSRRGHAARRRDDRHGNGRGLVKVLMTHEIAQKGPRDPSERSEPRVGRPGQRGAFASEWTLNRKGQVISGRRAFARVFQDDTFVGPTADESNTTPAFSRWCSAFLAGPEDGLDRYIFFANEESGPTGSPPEEGKTTSFDPKGSQAVAIFDNEAHALSKLGRFPRENAVVMRHTGNATVILMTEDGPAGTTDSQLYMYVGRKDRSSRSVLRRNGLDNGKLYVFASDDSRDNENAILQGDTVPGHFVEIPGAAAMNDVQLDLASDAVGAFGFARVEDAMFNPRSTREAWFATTGEQQNDSADPHINELGRLYKLRFDRGNPLATTMTQAFNPDQMTPAQDGPMTPDNLDLTGRWVAVQEDGTSASRPEIQSRGDRDGSIWLVPTATPGDTSTFKRIVELVGHHEGGRDGIVTPTSGMWESSGIIDTSDLFGSNTLLFDVQAHAPTTPPGGSEQTREDGQLLLARGSRSDSQHGRSKSKRGR
jgi:hypothetical protein